MKRFEYQVVVDKWGTGGTVAKSTFDSVTIHHSAVQSNVAGYSAEARAKSYAKSHRNKGYHGIAYHFMIPMDSSNDIYVVNFISGHTWHNSNYVGNKKALAVLIDGNFEIENPSAKQLQKLKQLLDDLQNDWFSNNGWYSFEKGILPAKKGALRTYSEGIKVPSLHFHNEVAQKGKGTACCGARLKQYVVEYRDKAGNVSWGVPVDQTPKPEEPDWKKGWTKKEESLEPVKEYHLFNIIDGKKIKSHKPEGKKVHTMYQKEGWRMTQFSWENNLPNAFKLSELIWRPEPEPTPIPVEPKITKLWEVRISHETNVDEVFSNIDETVMFKGEIGSFEVAKISHKLAIEYAKEKSHKQERDLLVFTVERTFEDGKQKEVKMIESEVIEFEEPDMEKEYLVEFLPFNGLKRSLIFSELETAQKEYFKVKEQLNQGDELRLFENGILINAFKKPMERSDDMHKTVGDHLRSTLEIAAPVQAVTTFVGVIFAFYNPEMPMEVILAFTGLFGIGFNVTFIVGSKLLEKFDQ